MTVPQYLENINKRYKLGNATEQYPSTIPRLAF